MNFLYGIKNKTLSIDEIENKVSNYMHNIPKGDINQINHVKEILDYMYEFDQEYLKLYEINNNVTALNSITEKLFKFNTNEIKKILSKHGWITISKFGREYDHMAWLIVQHADDFPFFQAGVLFILHKMVEQGETDPKNYAYLYDRVADKFNHIGLLQKYGTQVDIKNNQAVLAPFEGDINSVNKCRNEVGLGLVEEYLLEFAKVRL